LLSELTGVEMIPEGWHDDILPALLLKKHKNESVDSNTGLRALVAYDLSPCSFLISMFIHSKQQVEHGID
jgi:hypothetical protein